MVGGAFRHVVEVRRERHARADDFGHHAHRERAGADGGITNGDVAQKCINLSRKLANGLGRLGVVIALHSGGDGGGVVGELVALANPEFEVGAREHRLRSSRRKEALTFSRF